MTLTLAHIALYPVKSCAGIALEEAEIAPRGLQSGRIGDRRWMLVDESGAMVSQRVDPAMARIRTALLIDASGVAAALHLSAEHCDPLVLQPGAVSGDRLELTMFGKAVVGHAVSMDADLWFSRLLDRQVRLIHQTDDDLRACEAAFRLAPDDQVGFADAYPYLLANPATLAGLGLSPALPIERFRANLLVAGADADAEYGWGEISIGEARLALVKPCTRCQVTTIDQTLGVTTGAEPLTSLSRRYFLSTGEGDSRIQGVVFGENAIARQGGRVRRGDPIAVLSRRPSHAFGQRVA